MTHIENIPHILLRGITHAQSANANPAYTPIGDGSLIATRNGFLLANGRRLGDYIPFYFGVRMPMLYVVQKGYNMVAATAPENIVYCVSSVENITNSGLPFVFTNGHAVDGFTTQHSQAEAQNMDKLLDWAAINATFWKSETDLDLKRRKEAEFLVQGDIPVSAIIGYAVFNNNAKDQLIKWGVATEKVAVRPGFYF